jgi:isoleucyl-tRNA synthetase
VGAPIIVKLRDRGIQLRFDGPDQRLRLIEVIDFTKTRFTYDGKDILKQDHPKAQRGPTFKSIYTQFGPTTPGDFHPAKSKNATHDDYELSYPGVSFRFPVQAGIFKKGMRWAETVNFLYTSAVKPAVSMAIFHGESWSEASKSIYTTVLPFQRSPIFGATRKDYAKLPKEIEFARIHGHGQVELVRKNAPSVWILLNETTPQDLVAELGPPDEIFKKPRHASVHRPRAESYSRPSAKNDFKPSSWGSINATSSATETSADEDEDLDNITAGNPAEEPEQYFWNYYSHGLDILISPNPHSRIHPKAPTGIVNPENHHTPTTTHVTQHQRPTNTQPVSHHSHPVATKLLIHTNVPFTHAFNRHRRLRFEIAQPPRSSPDPPEEGDETEAQDVQSSPVTSETPWHLISESLKRRFHGRYYGSAEEERGAQQPMAVNRGWGGRSGEGSLGESGELLGGWEGVVDEDDVLVRPGAGGWVARKDKGDASKMEEFGQAEMYGEFPGLIFEVLRNGIVCQVQVY